MKLGMSCDPDCPVQTPNRAAGPKWGKNGRKMDFGSTGKKGEKWPNNGKNGPKLGQKWPFSHFCCHFSPFFPVEPKSSFRPFFFSRFGPEARFGVCTGQTGSQGMSEHVSPEVPQTATRRHFSRMTKLSKKGASTSRKRAEYCFESTVSEERTH